MTNLFVSTDEQEKFLKEIKDAVRNWDNTRFAILTGVIGLAGFLGVNTMVDRIVEDVVSKRLENTMTVAQTTVDQTRAALVGVNTRAELSAEEFKTLKEDAEQLQQEISDEIGRLRLLSADLANEFAELQQRSGQLDSQFDASFSQLEEIKNISVQLNGQLVRTPAPSTDQDNDESPTSALHCKVSSARDLILSTSPVSLGCAQRADDEDIQNLASSAAISEVIALQAFLDVAVGQFDGFTPDGHPLVYYDGAQVVAAAENPKLVKQIREKGTDIAGAGIAIVRQVFEIDSALAVENSIWGLGRLQGDQWQNLGYHSADAFVAAMYRSEREQIRALLLHLEKRGGIKAINDKSWDSVWEAYAGEPDAEFGQFIAERYDSRLNAQMLTALPEAPSPSQIARMQAELRASGYLEGGADGLLGMATVAAVTRYQEAMGLEANGLPDDKTLAMILQDK